MVGRPIIIDGCNVAYDNANHRYFSWDGIRAAVDFFRAWGFHLIKVVLPSWRRVVPPLEVQWGNKKLKTIGGRHIGDLEREGVMLYVPNQDYDDLHTLELAHRNGGVAVSNDNYNDIYDRYPDFQGIIEGTIKFQFTGERFHIPGRPNPVTDDRLWVLERESGPVDWNIFPLGNLRRGNKKRRRHARPLF